MSDNSQVDPLIYTTKGNVPISSLRYEHRWDVNDAEIRFQEFWYDETDEIVKNNFHVYVLKAEGLAFGSEQPTFA